MIASTPTPARVLNVLRAIVVLLTFQQSRRAGRSALPTGSLPFSSEDSNSQRTRSAHSSEGEMTLAKAATSLLPLSAMRSSTLRERDGNEEYDVRSVLFGSLCNWRHGLKSAPPCVGIGGRVAGTPLSGRKSSHSREEAPSQPSATSSFRSDSTSRLAPFLSS